MAEFILYLYVFMSLQLYPPWRVCLRGGFLLRCQNHVHYTQILPTVSANGGDCMNKEPNTCSGSLVKNGDLPSPSCVQSPFSQGSAPGLSLRTLNIVHVLGSHATTPGLLMPALDLGED